MKLNLGAGSDIRIGWENTDKEEDIFKMERRTESIEAILLNHVAMYIRPEEMEQLLIKWYRWLKPDGTIHIETQDLNKVRDPETLFGTGKHAGHRWAWTPKALIALMEKAGFKKIGMVAGILHGKPERDFLICGKK